jgi:hypothetical protein
MDEPRVPVRHLAAVRVAVGAAQGFALFLLSLALEHGRWPASDGPVFAPLVLVALYIPVLVIAALGVLRARTLVLWAIGAAAMLAGLALHDVTRGAEPVWWPWVTAPTFVAPSTVLVLSTGLALFIAHNLVSASDAERRLVASYPRYFDDAWKHGVQLALSISFTCMFWGLLYLGAQLFELVKLDFLSRLIERRWFAFPVTTAVFALALHVTDVRVALVRGIRTLSLALLSWLLPLMAVLAAGFVTALFFTGLEPLWATRHATPILLGTSAVLVVLLNAAYQGGAPETTVPIPVRWTGRLAGLVLVPLVAFGAYSLALRIGQYGWTPDRVAAAACALVGACYAAGYAAAAVMPGRWMRWLERTNIAAAVAILVVFVTLFTPLADPARISVADQVRRLLDGRVAAERFDFAFLRFEAAGYGRAALERLRNLQEGPSAAYIAAQADRMLKRQDRWKPVPAEARDLAANIKVHPEGVALPEAFLHRSWTADPARAALPSCLTDAAAKCDAFLADLDGDAASEIVLVPPYGSPAAAFRSAPDGSWTVLGTYAVPAPCRAAREALRAGSFTPVQPDDPRVKDIEAGGVRLRLQPVNACP